MPRIELRSSAPPQVDDWHSDPDHGVRHPHGHCTLCSPQLCPCHFVHGIEALHRVANFTFLACSDEDDVAHTDSIVIAVKGICRGNGTADSRGAAAVFFHENSNNNRTLTPIDVNTSQRADLRAALKVLRMALRIRARNKQRPCPPPGPYRRLRRVMIKTNSKYLVDAMVSHIDRWNGNGYINAKGENVVNEDLFRKLDDAREDLEDQNVVVQFWRVPKCANCDATDLANAALDMQGKKVVRRWDCTRRVEGYSSDESW